MSRETSNSGLQYSRGRVGSGVFHSHKKTHMLTKRTHKYKHNKTQKNTQTHQQLHTQTLKTHKHSTHTQQTQKSQRPHLKCAFSTKASRSDEQMDRRIDKASERDGSLRPKKALIEQHTDGDPPPPAGTSRLNCRYYRMFKRFTECSTISNSSTFRE